MNKTVKFIIIGLLIILAVLVILELLIFELRVIELNPQGEWASHGDGYIGPPPDPIALNPEIENFVYLTLFLLIVTPTSIILYWKRQRKKV